MSLFNSPFEEEKLTRNPPEVDGELGDPAPCFFGSLSTSTSLSTLERPKSPNIPKKKNNVKENPNIQER